MRTGASALKEKRVRKASTGSGVNAAKKRESVERAIAHRSTEKRTEPFDRAAYRERNRVERLINRLKQFRRIVTRYEKRTANYLALDTWANEQLQRLAYRWASGREKFRDEDNQAHEGAYGSDKNVKEWISLAHLREEVPHIIQDRASRADLDWRNPTDQEQQHDNAETKRDKACHEYYQSIESISHISHSSFLATSLPEDVAILPFLYTGAEASQEQFHSCDAPDAIALEALDAILIIS